MHGAVFFCMVIAMHYVSFAADRAANGQQKPGEIPNIAEAVAMFNDSIAVLDIDNDTALDCLTARKIQYDPDEWSVTYLWNTAGGSEERFYFPVHLTPADTPDTFHISTSIKPGQSFLGHIYYLDRTGCVVGRMPHIGNECILWITKEHKGSIPDECIEQFAHFCGKGVFLHDKAICKDVDESAFPDTPDDA